MTDERELAACRESHALTMVEKAEAEGALAELRGRVGKARKVLADSYGPGKLFVPTMEEGGRVFQTVNEVLALLSPKGDADPVPVMDAQEPERSALLDALETADSWLMLHARHVGSCVGKSLCTCGLEAVRAETGSVLASTRSAGTTQGGSDV